MSDFVPQILNCSLSNLEDLASCSDDTVSKVCGFSPVCMYMLEIDQSTEFFSWGSYIIDQQCLLRFLRLRLNSVFTSWSDKFWRFISLVWNWGYTTKEGRKIWFVDIVSVVGVSDCFGTALGFFFSPLEVWYTDWGSCFEPSQVRKKNQYEVLYIKFPRFFSCGRPDFLLILSLSLSWKI